MCRYNRLYWVWCWESLSPGLVTNSVLFCWIFTIKDKCRRCIFKQMHKQGLRQLFRQCSGTSTHSMAHLKAPYKRCPCFCSSGSNAWCKSRAIQGSETETRELLEGTTENSVSPNEGSLIGPPGKSMIFHKKETEKIELVARPEKNVNFRILICNT